jgi:tetratricopeptide (TPR) repeat protein
MIARWLLAISLFFCLSPLLYAQSASPQEPGATQNKPLVDPSRYDKKGNSLDKMYEDIEIFRRILDRKLNAYYPQIVTFVNTGGGMMGLQGGGMMGMQSGMAGLQGGGMMSMGGGGMGAAISHSLEGVYLEGQGIVYTATLASRQPHGRAEAPPPPPVDEWENARRQIRNEKEEPKKAEPSKPPEVSDVVLKLLAEHGRHFSQVNANEGFIFILTVRAADAPPAKKLTKKAEQSAASRQAHELELVGDLHLKQQQYDVAISNYHKAMELDPGDKLEASLRRKLAQCYLAQEKYEKARTELDEAMKLLKRGKDDKDKAASAPAAVLPEKVIITVPKRLLDMALTNKMPFEEFRRHAMVRKLTFGEGQR